MSCRQKNIVNGEPQDVVQDVRNIPKTDPPFGAFFSRKEGTQTTLTVPSVIDSNTITVANAASFGVGRYLGIFSGTSLEGRYYFGTVVGVLGNVLTMDTPLDFDFDAGDPVVPLRTNINELASIVSPVKYSLSGFAPNAPILVNITRLMITMETASTPTLNLFGDIAKLVNGIVLRRRDGDIRNLFNIKKNINFASKAYDLTFFSAIGQGQDGLTCRYTFAGEDKHGVVIQLDGSEALELITQDDLSLITEFTIFGEGNIVTTPGVETTPPPS
jgi:hypothetical protein